MTTKSFPLHSNALAQLEYCVYIYENALTGFFPSHLSFLLRHLSHACETRFRGPFFPIFGTSSDAVMPLPLSSARLESSNCVCGAMTFRNLQKGKLQARVWGRPKGKAAWIGHEHATRRAYGISLYCQVILLVSCATVSRQSASGSQVGGLAAAVRPQLDNDDCWIRYYQDMQQLSEAYPFPKLGVQSCKSICPKFFWENLEYPTLLRGLAQRQEVEGIGRDLCRSFVP
jgi:hypothetical protein